MSGIIGAYQGSFGRVTFFDITEPVADHAHPHVHLLFRVAGGKRSMVVGVKPVELGADNCILVNPWQRHADVAHLCTEPSLMLALYIDPDWFQNRFGSTVGPVFDECCRQVPASVTALAAEISSLVSDVTECGIERLETAVADLIDGASQFAGRDAVNTTPSDYRIRRAVGQLTAEPRLHPDFLTIARSVGLSRSRFFEQFRKSVGVAPTMFVDGLLVERAIDLLVCSNTTIDEISAMLGFSAQSSFSRFFKDRVGFPPSSLRRAATSTIH